jgi:hypothetical protein
MGLIDNALVISKFALKQSQAEFTSPEPYCWQGGRWACQHWSRGAGTAAQQVLVPTLCVLQQAAAA